jgi:hypothetical protein
MSAPGFYQAIKRPRQYDPTLIADWLSKVSPARVAAVAHSMETYVSQHLPTAIRSKSGLSDYRTSPYGLMATAGSLRLDDPGDLSEFLVGLKLYMGLETSFGKSIERVVMRHYPAYATIGSEWNEPEEKVAEFALLRGLTQEEKSQRRVSSVWREIDTSCVVGGRRHLMSIKSGTSTINDTQVGGMFSAIRDNSAAWLQASIERHAVSGIDVVIGLTYGSDRSTNNKENQILAKLLTCGFYEMDRQSNPGVLVNHDGSIRIYRVIGIDYWAYTASPNDPSSYEFAFLEVILGLAEALRLAHERGEVRTALEERVELLASAIREIRGAEAALPDAIDQKLGPSELTWLAAATSAFFDR